MKERSKNERPRAKKEPARPGRKPAGSNAKRPPKPEQAPAAAPIETPGTLPGDIVELEEAQALLKTTRSTLYRWIRQGRLRGMKAGRQWRFRREDLRRFLEGESAELALPVGAQPFVDALTAYLRQVAPKDRYTAPPQMPLLLQAANLLLMTAIRLGASDIHVTPNRDAAGQLQVPIRLRVDGLLRTVVMLVVGRNFARP